MFERVFQNIGLDAPPKPREFFLSPRELKNGIRADTGLPTDPSELISDVGLPSTPKQAVGELGLPQIQELTPAQLLK